MRVAASLLFLLVIAAPRAGAQQCAPKPPGVLDTVMIFASVLAPLPDSAPIRTLRGTVLQQFVEEFPELHSVILSKRVAAELVARRDGGANAPPAPFAELRFTVHSGGAVSEVHLVRTTSDPPFDSALVGTATQLGAAGAPFFAADQRDTLQMRVQLAISDRVGDFPLPIVRVLMPRAADRTAKLQPTNVYPKWPKSMEKARVEDDVVIQFRISPSGRAMTDSVRIIQGKHQEYIDAVIAVLPEYRWAPAIVGGCAAAQWTQMPFMFHFK